MGEMCSFGLVEPVTVLPLGSRAGTDPPTYTLVVCAVVTNCCLIPCGVSSVPVSREGKSSIIAF